MTSCVSFTANRLRPAGLAGDGFTMPANFGVSPELWLTYSRPTRLSYLRSFYPRRAGESGDQYDARLSALATRITTEAFARGAKFPRPLRPAGAGAGTDLTKDTGDGTTTRTSYTGLTPEAQTAAVGAAASILGMGAQTLAAAIHDGNETERARIAEEARVRIAELQAQNPTDPATASATQSMIDTLTQLREQLGAQTGLSTGAMIGIAAAGVLAIGGIAYIAMRPRGDHSPRHNPVVIDAHGRRKFVPAWKVRHNPFHPDVYQAYPIDKETGLVDTYNSTGEYDFRKYRPEEVIERFRGDALEETRDGAYVLRDGKRKLFLWRMPEDHRGRIHYR